MTNGEKFKTEYERTEEHKKFCKKHDGISCSLCEAWSGTDGNCCFTWLNLDCDKDEKPVECPFCGGKEIRIYMVEDMSDGYMSAPKISCSGCGANFTLDWDVTSEVGDKVTDEQRKQLISLWNRRSI